MVSRDKWRKWLAKNYEKSEVVWLALKKKDSAKSGICYIDAVEEAICYGWIDGQVKSFDKDFFIQRFTPRKSRSIWSKINKDRALKLIKEGKMTEAGLQKIEDAKKNGQWQKAYTTPKKVETPADLIQVLIKVKGAWEAFNSFAPSHRNMYVLWVNDAKKEDTRKRRMEKVAKRSLQKMKPGIL